MILAFMIFFMIVGIIACGGWIISSSILKTERADNIKEFRKLKEKSKSIKVNNRRYTSNDIHVILLEYKRYKNLYNRYRPKDPVKDYKTILGLSDVHLTKAGILSAYKKRAKVYHPDMPNGSEEKMKTLNMAKDIAIRKINA